MPDFLQLVSMLREQMSATLSRSDVLKPLAWLVGIVATATAIALFAKPQEWVVHWLLVALLSSIGLYGAAFVFCLIFDRDALRSEKYSLNKLAIEHGLLGDSTAGMFDPRTIAGDTQSRPPTSIDVPKIEKPE
jgi:hypothetical protein